MTLQNIIFPDVVNDEIAIYVRGTKNINISDKSVVISQGCMISTDTYMNMFDLSNWKKYTDINNVFLRLKISGKGIVRVWCEQKNEVIKKIGQVDFSQEKNEVELCVSENIADGMIYFDILAIEETNLLCAEYVTNDTVINEVKITAIICTYKRKEQIEKLLKELNKVVFNKKVWLAIKVVDNGSELLNDYERVQIYHNLNTGGSGGFTRGMKEAIRDTENFSTTHILLMDDDVQLNIESIYRLYALLSYLKVSHQGAAVAGRMFRTDKRNVQYTAAEIWNEGKIGHIGWNRDMTERENIFNMNNNDGAEYSGWWFACYPIEFVSENKPMPFFLHCDDVEYGLRHGGVPIIMNGIQVWHETYEYRDSDIMQYYDIRNTLFVNELYVKNFHSEKVLLEWKEKISIQHNKQNYVREYMIIRGLYDFCRGREWLYRVNAEKLNRRLKSTKSNRIRNAIMWRLAAQRYKKYLKGN